MTDKIPLPDDFSPEERAALAAWTVSDPDADFAARVIERDSARRSRRLLGGVIGGLAIAASIALVMLAGGRQPISGSHRATERTTLQLGDRATAVSEVGTELEWRIESNGAASIDQRAGDTFYRVERGGPFVVHTPRGDVRVLGTCFRVEVQTMRATSSGLIGAGLGAAVATTVMVTVYEGKVVTASPQGELTIAAGESAALEPERAPKLVTKKRIEGPSPEQLQERTLALNAALADLPPNATPAQVIEAHRTLKREAEKMRTELDAMRAELAEASKSKKSRKTYDLDQTELNRMAEHCELAWDMQGLGAKPQSMRPEDVEKLKMSESEREVVNRVFEEDHRRVLKDLAALYVEVTGDTTSGSMAGGAMFEEIVDKAPPGELQRVFQKLARERAGLIPPSDPKTATPWERVFRLMTSAGDELQRAFAKELGPDTAKALRDLHEGWGSRSRSSSGCPQEQ